MSQDKEHQGCSSTRKAWKFPVVTGAEPSLTSQAYQQQRACPGRVELVLNSWLAFLFELLCYLGPQPNGWCCLHPGQVFLLSYCPTYRIRWNRHRRHTQRCGFTNFQQKKQAIHRPNRQPTDREKSPYQLYFRRGGINIQHLQSVGDMRSTHS